MDPHRKQSTLGLAGPPFLPLRGRSLFDVRGDRPHVSRRIEHPPGAVTPELVVHHKKINTATVARPAYSLQQKLGGWNVVNAFTVPSEKPVQFVFVGAIPNHATITASKALLAQWGAAAEA